MKRTTITITAIILVLLLAACDPAAIGNALKKTGDNIFSSAVTTDTSSATQTSSAAMSAVNKDEGSLVPADKQEKQAFVEAISEMVSKATASDEKQEALGKELKKPVDEETKSLMETNLPALNTSLKDKGIEVTIELPEKPTVMNLIVMQMLSVVDDMAAADPKEDSAVKQTAAAALKTVEVVSNLSKAGQVDVLAIALPFITDIVGQTKAFTEDQIPDEAARYARMMISIFNEMIRASDSDGDTYLDPEGLAEAIFALKAKRIAYESAGTAVYNALLPEEEERVIYYPGWTLVKSIDEEISKAAPKKKEKKEMSEIFEQLLKEPSGTFTLGNLLDYMTCEAMTEFEEVFGSPLDSMLTKTATDSIRKYLASPTKQNLADLVNLDEFEGFIDRMDDFDFWSILGDKSTRKTACVMVADVNIETFNNIIRDLLKEEN